MTRIHKLLGRPVTPSPSRTSGPAAPRGTGVEGDSKDLLPKPSLWNPFKSNFVDRPSGRPSRPADRPESTGKLMGGAANALAGAAVPKARTDTQVIEARITPDLPLVDAGTVTSKLTLADDVKLSALELKLDLEHTWRGDLVVSVTSPSGKTVTVSDRKGGSADDLIGTFDLSAFEGESAKGEWTLTVSDKARRDTGTLRGWGLTGLAEVVAPEPPAPPRPQPLTGDPVVVVLDGGVEAIHEDLDSAMWTNVHEVAGDGIDNDNNGYLDDVHGINLAEVNGDVDKGDGTDHGTHVAGIIAAEDNGVGNTGIAAGKARIMAIGGMYEGADSITNFEAAVDYMVEQKSKGVNIRVVNASFGEDVRDARELERWSAATRKLLDADILLVAATANGYGSNMDKTPGDRPANADFPNVVVVASLDRKQEKLANFSSYGPTTVDLAAPGEDIVSTIPRGKWDEMSGTSMATPHVAAAAALMFAANPELKATQVAELLLKTAVKDPDLAGKVLTGAKLDVKAAVKAAEALRPQNAGNDRVVTWS